MASNLATALEAETAIIEDTERQAYAILGTEDIQKNDFKIYPNPVADNMVIDSSEKINSYEIVNTLGQSIFKGVSTENINEFLPSLAHGTYLLKVITDSGKQETLRFIKK